MKSAGARPRVRRRRCAPPAAAQTRRGRPKVRRGRWRRATSSFPPYEMRTLDNGLQVVAVLHHEQPVVSMRMIVRAGARSIRAARPGSPISRRRSSIRARRRESANEMNDAIDFIGGAMGAGAGTDLTFVNIVVMKDSFETGLRHAVRHGAASGVRAGGDRAAAPADAVDPAGELRGSRSSSPTPCSIGSSTAFTRTACRRAARRRRSRRSRATISSRSTRRTSCRTTPFSPSSAT